VIGGFVLIAYEFIRRWIVCVVRRLSLKKPTQAVELVPSLARSLSLNKTLRREFFAPEFRSEDNLIFPAARKSR
jgi:hypothetical protein